jgi:hypothetical protein
MAKALKTASELAYMVKAVLAMKDAQVVVSAQQTVGWSATVITVSTQALAAQLKADVIAARLRSRFDLKK